MNEIIFDVIRMMFFLKKYLYFNVDFVLEILN